MATSNTTYINIICKDGTHFNIPLAIANMIPVIKDLIECIQEDGPIPLCNINGNVFQRIIDYCEANKDGEEQDVLKHYMKNTKYFNNTSVSIIDILNAANFLSIESLINLCCRKIALDMMRGPIEDVQKTVLEMMENSKEAVAAAAADDEEEEEDEEEAGTAAAAAADDEEEDE